MQLTQRHNTVTSGGNIGTQSNFGIAINAKMFRVLSDTMYTNKIGSIVRELSSNALDGHTKAGTPEKPFEIHVPNAIEPWFSVKDTGVGMSDDDIRTVYTTYGSSTKDTSNDEVGAFGLGAKTPFAYTDQFTITSVYEGVSRTYVAVFADDGPVLNQQVETPTTEPNGVEVTIAVDSNDIREFKDEILTQLKFFKVKPVLTNNMEKIAFADINNESSITLAHDLFTLYKGYNRSEIHNSMWVIQGGVGYPVNIGSLTGLDNNVKTFAEGLRELGITMEFPIGDISVTASRESISYEPNTINSIKKRLTDIATLITTEAIENIRKYQTIWERAVEFNNQIDVVKQAIAALPDFKTIFGDKSTSVDRQLKMRIDASHCQDTLGYTLTLPRKYEYRSRGSYGYKTRVDQKKVTSENYRGYDRVSLIPVHDMRIIIADKCTRQASRIKKFCEDMKFQPVLIVKTPTFEYDMQAIADSLNVDVSKLEMLSTFEPEMVIRQTSTGGEARPKAYMWNSGNSFTTSKNWRRIYDDIDELEDTIYVETNRNDVKFEDGFYTIMQAITYNLIDYKVIAVNSQVHKKIVAGKLGNNLLTCADVIDEVTGKLEQVDRFKMQIAKYRTFIQSFGDVTWVNALAETVPKFARLQRARLAIKNRIEILNKRMVRMGNWHKMDYIDSHNSHENLRIAQAYAEKQAKMYEGEVYKDYPMLQHVSKYTDFDVVNDYINLVNNSQGA